MLREDLKTVRNILRAKMRVKAYLQETADWCRTGLWYVEGQYARHRQTSLPDGLRDAIHGIWRRQVLRGFVERIAPPWFAYVPHPTPTAADFQCSIAYLSKDGDWKLFDLEGQQIWTRPLHATKIERELANSRRFGAFFHIPPWHTLKHNERLWRSDKYICGPNLAHCSDSVRREVVEALFQQFATFASTAAIPPAPELTQGAVSTLMKYAPNSIPATIASKYSAEMQRLGAGLKLLPSHGDLSAQNVLVQDGRPWIIDWTTAGHYQPVLYDMLYLIVREAALGRVDLLHALLHGYFDRSLERMFALTGLPARPCDNLVMLIHSYIVHFHSIKQSGRRDAEADNVDRLWNPLRGFCTNYL